MRPSPQARSPALGAIRSCSHLFGCVRLYRGDRFNWGGQERPTPVFSGVLLPDCYPVAVSSVGLATPAPPRSRPTALGSPTGRGERPGSPRRRGDTPPQHQRRRAAPAALKGAESTRQPASSLPPLRVPAMPRLGSQAPSAARGPHKGASNLRISPLLKIFFHSTCTANIRPYIHLTMAITIDSVYNDSANAVHAAYAVEPWMTKQQLAGHLNMSTRWVEMWCSGTECR